MRRKHNTRGRRGIALLDRETHTARWQLACPNSMPRRAAASSAMSRCAAAAAALLIVANMVALENRITFTLPSAPQPPPTAAASKDKKPKELLTPPAYASTVLRPSAHVVAPTRSTAADASMSSAPADNEAQTPEGAQTRGRRERIYGRTTSELYRWHLVLLELRLSPMRNLWYVILSHSKSNNTCILRQSIGDRGPSSRLQQS